MSDENKSIVKKITEGPFFTLSKSPLEYIEKGKIFKLLFNIVCILMVIRTVVYPFIILGRVAVSGYFNFGLRYVLAFVFVWASILIASWLGLHLWLEKRKKAESFTKAEFVALPFFAEMIKTFGEWLGIMYIIIGAVGGIFSLIFLGGYSGGMLSAVIGGVNINIGSEGALMPIISEVVNGLFSMMDSVFDFAIILGPVFGCSIVLISRFISERLWVLAAIANNTKKSAGL